MFVITLSKKVCLSDIIECMILLPFFMKLIDFRYYFEINYFEFWIVHHSDCILAVWREYAVRGESERILFASIPSIVLVLFRFGFNSCSKLPLLSGNAVLAWNGMLVRLFLIREIRECRAKYRTNIFTVNGSSSQLIRQCKVSYVMCASEFGSVVFLLCHVKNFFVNECNKLYYDKFWQPVRNRFRRRTVTLE